ncbi:triose-phosphate isomerase, partial [Candidatus Pelagibacter sp.]|nr:triose-phosphate isomerase [Candidatus Pelagibacter sp.]
KLKVIFCIGESLSEKRKKKTKSILLKQIKYGLKNIKDKSNIFLAYEPVWAIGSGIIPKSKDLFNTVEFIKGKFKDKPPKVLYGGSVNPKNITNLKEINNIDGFLIGGASQNAQKFIDIIKKTYS